MIKILYDCQAFDMQTHGGVSKCFTELYKHLPHEVAAEIGVIETDNVYLQELGYPPLGYVYNHFISGHNFPAKRFLYKACKNIIAGHPSRWDCGPRVNQYYSERLIKQGNYDVFHPTYFDDYFLSYLKNKPFVVTVHDMIPELFPQYFAKDDAQILLKRKVVPLASHIIAVSEQTKKDVVRLMNIPEDKVSVVYHGTSFKPYVPSVAEHQDYEYLLYVGERRFYKNFMAFCQEILPVLKRHQEMKVICTGKPFSDDELCFFKEKGIRDRFVHRFVKSEQEMLDLYHDAVAFIYPSSYEGFGIPILEAYKANCPVMLNRASCFPEIAGDAAIYFNIDDMKSDLAEQLETLYGLNHDERNALLAKQRQRLQRYSWEQAAKALVNIYNKCC